MWKSRKSGSFIFTLNVSFSSASLRMHIVSSSPVKHAICRSGSVRVPDIYRLRAMKVHT